MYIYTSTYIYIYTHIYVLAIIISSNNNNNTKQFRPRTRKGLAVGGRGTQRGMYLITTALSIALSL